MKKILAMVAVLAVGLGLAQQGQGPGGGFQMDPEMRKKLQAYQVVFDLTRTVGMLEEVDKQKGLAFTKAQAQKLLPVLKNLQSRADLKPADAEKILVNLEDNLLTDAQLKWIDKTQLEREAQARQRREEGRQGGPGQGQQGQPGQFQGQRPQGQQGQQGQRPGGPGGQGGIFQAIQQGKPFNPFKDQPRAAEQLKNFITVLSKR